VTPERLAEILRYVKEGRTRHVTVGELVEALAIREGRAENAEGTSEILSQHLAATAQKLHEVEGRLAEAALRDDRLLNVLRETEGRLAEATEALRDIAEGGPNGAGRTVSAPERAREALRAEPAKDDPNEGLAEEFTQAQEWGFDHPPLRGQA
jgi:hypothetical protein